MEVTSPESSKEGKDKALAANAPEPKPQASASSAVVEEDPPIMDEFRAFGDWVQKNPLPMALLLAFIGFFVWLYGYHDTFVHNTVSTMKWMWDGANPDSEQSHGRMVPFIALGMIWMARYQLKETAGRGSNWGLAIVGMGILVFLIGIRCVQPRFALVAIPFFLVGSVSYLWGNKTARVLLFPAVFLLFMIPVAAISQATFSLQFIITDVVGFVTRSIGIGVQAMGTTLTASDGTFNFEVAEGCSGIRSLAAMTMLTAVYVYVTQNRWWKKVAIFAGSLIFAIIGNIGRILAIVLTARFYDPEFAAGLMHDYSGYVFFPIAVLSMLFFAKIVNIVGDFVESRFGKKAATGGAQ